MNGDNGVKRTEGEPSTPLGKVANDMTDLLEADPRFQHVKAIVLLHDDEKATAHFHGYDADIDAINDTLQFLQRLAGANGIGIDVVEVGGDQ